MGAVTYIGNGPNFMVKAIAEQHRVRTPSFFGYWPGRARSCCRCSRWSRTSSSEALTMHYPRPGEPIVPRLLRPLVLERYPGSFATDPDSLLLARDELGADAWQRLPPEPAAASA